MEPVRIHQSIITSGNKLVVPILLDIIFDTSICTTLLNTHTHHCECCLHYCICAGYNTIHINNTYHLLSVDCSSNQIEFQLREY